MLAAPIAFFGPLSASLLRSDLAVLWSPWQALDWKHGRFQTPDTCNFISVPFRWPDWHLTKNYADGSDRGKTRSGWTKPHWKVRLLTTKGHNQPIGGLSVDGLIIWPNYFLMMPIKTFIEVQVLPTNNYAIVVAQLAEQSLPKPNVRISKSRQLLWTFFYHL